MTSNLRTLHVTRGFIGLGGTARLGTATDCVLNERRKNGRMNLTKRKSEISALMRNFKCEMTNAMAVFPISQYQDGDLKCLNAWEFSIQQTSQKRTIVSDTCQR